MQRTLEAILACLRSRPDLFQIDESVTDAALRAAEQSLGRPLPESLKALYRDLNGYSTVDGNLEIYPLERGPGLTLVSATAQYREWLWPVPDEVVLFASNGSGEPYGLWEGARDQKRFPSPVVQIGEIFEPGSMGVAAAAMEDLLIEDALWTVLLNESRTQAAGAFGMPEADLPEDEVLNALLEGTPEGSDLAVRAAHQTRRLENLLHPRLDPALRDPYAARLDAEGVAQALA